MAWAVDQTLEAVRRLAVENDTMVVFVSDHGPHIEMCDEGGSVGPLRGEWVQGDSHTRRDDQRS